MRQPSLKRTSQQILWVDDEDGQLRLYSHLFSQQTPSRIQTTRFPTEALVLAENKLFDVIVIDVTIDYNGSPFGGLELYRQLVSRYGTDSLLVYSKFITEELLKRYSYPFNFVEIGDDAVGFAQKIAHRVLELRKRQRCFVAMPFGKEYEPIWRVVHRVVKAASFEPLRIDRERFNNSITERIFLELREAKMVLFVTVAQNPNVFYEAGFAHALGKEIITVADDYSSLPFDVRDRNAIAYGGDLRRLERLLGSKLRRLA